MAYFHLLVHDIQAPEGHTLNLVEAAEAPGNMSSLVREERDLDVADPAPGAGGVGPLVVGELRVSRHRHHLTLQGLGSGQNIVIDLKIMKIYSKMYSMIY